jgi:hypothetical protein
MRFPITRSDAQYASYMVYRCDADCCNSTTLDHILFVGTRTTFRGGTHAIVRVCAEETPCGM